MFSNQSVSVHASPPGIAIAGTPESARILEILVKSSQVAGGCTPAWLNESVRYQTVDLLASLKMKLYGWPLIWPSFCHASEKLFLTAVTASVGSGLIWFFAAKSLMT